MIFLNYGDMDILLFPSIQASSNPRLSHRVLLHFHPPDSDIRNVPGAPCTDRRLSNLAPPRSCQSSYDVLRLSIEV